MSTPAEFFSQNKHHHRKALEMLGHPPRRSRDEETETPAENFRRTKEGQRQALEALGHPRVKRLG